MFIKHNAPNRCLCIKVAKSTMCNWSLDWGLQRCHNYKIAVSCVQRMEVIVKMKKREKKSGGGGMCTKNESGWMGTENWSFCENSFFFFFFFLGGGGSGQGVWSGGQGAVNGEKSFCENSKKKFLRGGVGRGRGVGWGSDQGLGWGRWG